MKRTLVIGACVSALSLGPVAGVAAAADAGSPKTAAVTTTSTGKTAQQRALFDPFIGLLSNIVPSIAGPLLSIPQQILGSLTGAFGGVVNQVLQSIVIPMTSLVLKPMTLAVDAPGFNVSVSFTPKAPLEGKADPIKTLLDVAGAIGVKFNVSIGGAGNYVCQLPSQVFKFALDSGQPASTSRATVKGLVKSGGESVPVVGTATETLPTATPVGDTSDTAQKACEAATSTLDPSIPDVSIEDLLAQASQLSVQLLGVDLPALIKGVIGQALTTFTTITNSTQQTVSSVRVRVKTPRGVTAATKTIKVGTLAPGASKRVKIKLRSTKAAARSSKVTVTAVGGGLRSVEKVALRLR
ncbi:NEW3 domain-containing protein [Patulibacter brassicae]|uniref:NEW3 domain-containing protein n=1 Tax=Patulibacter brassicae TaxID=1705717 RepID=A0ABU4VI08_9ACTN|nr:NEW3 domain-containing protein [Patulibacter brassicae]MDX8150784.1 NEW3 domain-containing protein [Patulibacter brassicae]